MAQSKPDYERLNSDKNLTVLLAPTSKATGVQKVGAPLATELEVGGAAGTQNASRTISWNDFGFGVQESEKTSDPSLADESTYEDFGQINCGGEMSFYMPQDYDDNSNNHSVIYDLTDGLNELLDVVTRLDGEKRNNTPVVDGDFVSVFRTQTTSDADSDTGSEAYRRTVGFDSQGDVAIYTIVGAHDITIDAPSTFTVGDKGRLMATVQDRDYTNALGFKTSDGAVINVYPGGFFEVTGVGTATVTVTDQEAGTSKTLAVTAA